MSEPITMPTLSDTMNTGRLVKWVKKLGDAIKKGDTIAEVETDKAVMEVEAFHDGYLAGPLASEGTEMPVGKIIGYIADSPGEAPAGEAQATPAAPKTAPPEPVRAANMPAEEGQGPKTAAAAVAKGAPAPAAKPAASPAKTTDARPPSAEAPPQMEEGAETKSAPSPQSPSPQQSEGARSAWLPAQSSSPQPTLEMSAPKAPGEGAQIVQANSIASSPLARPAAAAGAAPAAHGMSDQQIRALYPEGSYEIVPHDGMRRIIAQRLVQSNLTIPHFYITVDCDIGRLIAAREEINSAAPQDKDGKPLWKLSVNDLVIKALALALQRVPDANATWTESGMLKHRHSDVGVAVAIKGGLITPVVRKAETKSLSVISNEMNELAARARARKLKPEEYLGGASAVSNLGMYGIKDFTAVINPPQATILAVGAGEERPVARSGKIEIATIMTVTLSCDHRVVDGVIGAQLISAFKALIEQPVMMGV